MKMKRLALLLAGLWAAWWIFFEGTEAAGSRSYGQATVFLVLMGGGVALAWKRPLAGGALLFLEGVASVALFAPMWLRRFELLQVLLLFTIMCAPPLVSGAMLVWTARHFKTQPSRG